MYYCLLMYNNMPLATNSAYCYMTCLFFDQKHALNFDLNRSGPLATVFHKDYKNNFDDDFTDYLCHEFPAV